MNKGHPDSESSAYMLNDTLLNKVDKFKDLGVLFDQYFYLIAI